MFKNHAEGFYSDSTIQTFNFRKEAEILLLKRQQKLKKRDRKTSGKKIHRKDFDRRIQSIATEQKEQPDAGAAEHVEEPPSKRKRSCNNKLSQNVVSYSQNIIKIVGMAVAAELLSTLSIYSQKLPE